MKSTTARTAFVFSVTAFATVAQAAQIGGGPVFSENAASGYCFWINEGSTSIKPTSQKIFTSSGSVAVNTGCPNGSPVNPGTVCEVSPSVFATGQPYSCQLNFSTATTYVRGTMTLLDSSLNAAATAELR
jgi:hypothetical protein